MKTINLLIFATVLACGCTRPMHEEEERNLEMSIYYGHLRNNLEFHSSIMELLDAGDIESAITILKTLQFLDLQALDELTSREPDIKEGRVFVILNNKELNEAVTGLLTIYYTQSVRDAGAEYSNSENLQLPGRDSRQFLEKMRDRGFPKPTEQSPPKM